MVNALPRIFPHAIFLSLLLLLSLCLPLPLYLISLALFGLPHVIWELGFIRSRYAVRWPLRWWLALGLVLLFQAGGRAAVWWGSYSGSASQIVDLFSLLLLFLIVAAAPFRAGWRVRSAGIIFAGVIFYLLERGDILTALLVLALAHNFTPLALAWDMARDHAPAKPLAWTISALFLLPVLVAVSGAMWSVLPGALASYSPLLDGQLPPQWGGQNRQALLSAIVLAQCLHYYCVIYLLPRAEHQRVGKNVLSATVRIATVPIVLLLLTYYALDYSAARKLYAVAAGIHAWLEWPVLLMAWLACSSGVVAKAAPEKIL